VLLQKSSMGVAVATAMSFYAPLALGEIVDVTYAGQVTSGEDSTGVFGAQGADLTGDWLVVKYVFNTSVGYTVGWPWQQIAYGGSCCGAGSPALSATATVNGHSASIGPGTEYGEIYGFNGGPFSQQYDQDNNFTVADNVYTYNYGASAVTSEPTSLPAQIEGPFTYNTNPLDSSYNNVQIYTWNANTGAVSWAWADGTVSTLTIMPEVPEPSTWAMMLLGFAGLGFAGYRRATLAA
jgi:hypothetical protein